MSFSHPSFGWGDHTRCQLTTQTSPASVLNPPAPVPRGEGPGFPPAALGSGPEDWGPMHQRVCAVEEVCFTRFTELPYALLPFPGLEVFCTSI